MKKHYFANGKTYTFDIIYTEETKCGTVQLGVCRENGKTAWLDSRGIQFEGGRRFEATEMCAEPRVPYGYQMWGGELRDVLPHGARYYINKRR